ncbi:MAG: OmpH family outer membrane protein [Candidatus Theseobacter exili]|nr:OmpH family outer membrane protein [Candidatus Theseobacter exili]
MVKKVSCILVVVFTCVICLAAGKSVIGAETKMGYVDVEKVFNEYEYTKSEDSKLKESGRQKAQERDTMVSEIKRLKEEGELLSESASQEKQLVIDDKIKDLKDFDQQIRTELRNERDKLLREIFDNIRIIIEEYGKKNGYTFIFNEKALLYKVDSYDLTDEIIKVLNKQYSEKDKK